jgi:hypothetical protein
MQSLLSVSWPVALRKGRRSRLFENIMAYKLFGPKRERKREWKIIQKGASNVFFRHIVILV